MNLEEYILVTDRKIKKRNEKLLRTEWFFGRKVEKIFHKFNKRHILNGFFAVINPSNLNFEWVKLESYKGRKARRTLA